MAKSYYRGLALSLITAGLCFSPSAFAESLSEISNPVDSGEIIYDGKMDEWESLHSFGIDPIDINITEGQKVDWREAWIAHDSDNFYFGARYDTAIDMSWGHITYLDTDRKRDTGYRGVSDDMPIGVDYMIQGYNLWKYEGTGTSWSWSYGGALWRTWDKLNSEMSIPKSYLGNPFDMHVMFEGNNEPYGNTSRDFYPDTALSNGDYFTYSRGSSEVDLSTFSVIGNTHVTVEQYSEYIDAGAEAFDINGDPVTIKVTSNVDTSIVGSYIVYYNVEGGQIRRVVNVVAPVAMTCPATIETEETYEDSFISSATADKDWPNDFSFGEVGVQIIENIFNDARLGDSTIKGYKLKMPTQAVWDEMTVSKKALYLINSERCARGIRPYEGIDSTIESVVSEEYANLLAELRVLNHEADDMTPWERMALYSEVIVGSNADFFGYAENLAVASVGSIQGYSPVHEPIAKAVYAWLYADKDDTQGSYGHRKFVLATGLVENSGEPNKEGLIGIGVSSVNFEDVTEEGTLLWSSTYTVMNAFDPTEEWYGMDRYETVDLLFSDTCLSPYQMVDNSCKLLLTH